MQQYQQISQTWLEKKAIGPQMVTLPTQQKQALLVIAATSKAHWSLPLK